MSDVEAVVQVAVGGRAFTQMVEGEKRFDIVLRLPRDQRDDPEVIGRIPVDTPGPDGKPGARIPLSQLVKIDPHKPGASYIYRENNRRYIPIKFSVQGRDLASTIAEAQRKVADPKDGAHSQPRLRHRLVGRIRPDGAGQCQAALDRAAFDRPDHDPALRGIPVAQGRPPGHGERGGGRRWEASGR